VQRKLREVGDDSRLPDADNLRVLDNCFMLLLAIIIYIHLWGFSLADWWLQVSLPPRVASNQPLPILFTEDRHRLEAAWKLDWIDLVIYFRVIVGCVHK
jgi:hypothetical protein